MRFANCNKIEWCLNCQIAVKLIHKTFRKILLSLCRHQNITEQEFIFRAAQTHITEINRAWFSTVRRDDNFSANLGINRLSGNPKFHFSARKNPPQGLILSLMSPGHTPTRHVTCATCTQYTPSNATCPVPHVPSTHIHTPRVLCHMYPVHTLTRHVSLCHVNPVHIFTPHVRKYTTSHATCPCATCAQYTPSHATCPYATCAQYTPSHATCPCAICVQYTTSHATCPVPYEPSTHPHTPRVPVPHVPSTQPHTTCPVPYESSTRPHTPRVPIL